MGSMKEPPAPVALDEFRAAMRNLAGAVNIITSKHGEQLAGMTATAVCSVCADPPTLLVCINRNAATHAVVLGSGAFCVNVLRAEDFAMSAAFGGSADLAERFRTQMANAEDWRASLP